MCGIVGIVDYPRRLKNIEQVVRQMSDSLAHRGPDGEGQWIDQRAALGLGHRRLSIQDLSQEGAQPMTSSSGRYIIVFNGEIYNFRHIRSELEPLGYSFRGHSDTEVILAAVEEWGLKEAVTRFIGMFAFALWDTQQRTLSLVRDRIGIKPLYYGFINGMFAFASELKAIRLVPGSTGEINRDAVASMLRYCFIPAPHTIYKQVQKLSPGMILTLNLDHSGGNVHVAPYWSVSAVVEQAMANPYLGSKEEAVDDLDDLLSDAVGLRMLSDVPLGAFLSGGIDSSTVVALMQAQSTQPVKTFTIGFHEQGYNEAHHAKTVANHLGTEHTELYVSPNEALSVIPKLGSYYDEPFADSSQIPTLLISELTRKHVTVSLSGDGGDELFHGYRRYFEAERRWRQIGWLPFGVRRVLQRLIKGVSPKHWSKPTTLAEMLGAKEADNLYKWLLSSWKDPGEVVMSATESSTIFDRRQEASSLSNFAQRAMFFDMSLYLPDDILVKMDRASMAVSLEARVPILDHRVIEFAWRLPLNYKLNNGQGKWILKQVLNRYVPTSMVERPKQGFGVPIGSWLHGPLRDWAEALLDEHRIRGQNIFNPKLVRQKWQEHLSGVRDWHYELWNVLMFQAWLEEN